MENRYVRNRNINQVGSIEIFKGVFRKTLTYNKELMLCHFIMEKGAHIPLHNHKAVQNGYVIKGKIKFFKKDGSYFIAEAGESYVFDSMEYHGSDIYEDTELIESFYPAREEYMDK